MSDNPLNQHDGFITETQFNNLQAHISRGSFTEFYYDLHSYGSAVAGLYIPGPTGIGIFGAYSHLVSSEVTSADFFQDNQFLISNTIATKLISLIQSGLQGDDTYALPSIHRILEAEIEVFSEDVPGLTSEAYAGHDLIDVMGIEGIPGAIDRGVAGSNLIDGLVAAWSTVFDGGIFEYAGETLNESDIYYDDVFQRIEHPTLGDIPVGITNIYTAALIRSLSIEVSMRQEPEIWINTTNRADFNVMLSMQTGDQKFGVIMNSIYGDSVVEFPDSSATFAADGSITIVSSSGQGTVADWLLRAENQECFLAGTPITMWPIDPSLKPGLDGVYDKAQVRAGLWTKPIEQVSPKDLVLAHDKNGNMVPGYVPRTMVNESKIILDFHGTWVTPGHVYWCAEGKFAKQYAPLIDILRTDGAVEHENGTMVRAATGCEVGSLDDFPVKIIRIRNGQPDLVHPERLRLGARFITTDAKEKTFRDDVEKERGKLDAKGFFPDGQHISNLTFAWPEEQPWPSPEDYVMIRSQTTLEDIYRVSQWEYMRPQMPAPMVMDGGPIQPLPAHEIEEMKRNTPMAMLGLGQGGSPMAQKTLAGPGGKSPMNRKARKAAEARQRKATKGRSPMVVH